MPFVLMAVVTVCVTVWLSRQASVVQSEQAVPDRATPRLLRSPFHRSSTGDAPPMRSDLVGIRGWLFVYVIMLGLQALHDLGVTVAALVINARPSLAGLNSFVPLPSLLVWLVSNLIVVLYTGALYVLMSKRQKSAIANNVICNALVVVFLVCLHLLGMKSALGTIIDSLPSVLGTWYILVSRRVRNTFILTRSSRSHVERALG